MFLKNKVIEERYIKFYLLDLWSCLYVIKLRYYINKRTFGGLKVLMKNLNKKHKKNK